MPPCMATRAGRTRQRVRGHGPGSSGAFRVLAILPLHRSRWAASGLLIATLLTVGCSTASLDTARYSYYAGRPDLADKTLTRLKVSNKDEVLLLMERGMVRQTLGDYENSSQDLIQAYDRLGEMEAYSVSKGGASWVVNDNVQNFRGAPYERSLLHAFTAMNHLALGHWNDSAVEARRIIESLDPEVIGKYPDDPFCRYMAGFCLELNDEPSNAALQYQKASDLLAGLTVDPSTGHILPDVEEAFARPADDTDFTPMPNDPPSELVCFISVGRSYRGPEAGTWVKNWQPGSANYAELYADGQYLGRSYPLTDTVNLAFTTEQLDATRKAAKSAGRIAVKEVIAGSIESESSDAVGDLVRLVLIGLLEQPDVRRWETLPRWMQVARVPCPPDLSEVNVVFKNEQGYTTQVVTVKEPLQKHRNTYVALCRDLAVKTPGNLGEDTVAEASVTD